MTRPSNSTPPAEQGHGYRSRRTTRHEVPDGQARLAPQSRYSVEVKVRNVSTAGFMAECAAPVRIGSTVALQIPGIGVVEAQVRWQIGHRMGGMFLDPISLGRCEWTAKKA